MPKKKERKNRRLNRLKKLEAGKDWVITYKAEPDVALKIANEERTSEVGAKINGIINKRLRKSYEQDGA